MPGLLHTRNFRLWFICFIFSVSILLLILFLGTKGIYLQIGFPPEKYILIKSNVY